MGEPTARASCGLPWASPKVLSHSTSGGDGQGQAGTDLVYGASMDFAVSGTTAVPFSYDANANVTSTPQTEGLVTASSYSAFGVPLAGRDGTGSAGALLGLLGMSAVAGDGSGLLGREAGGAGQATFGYQSELTIAGQLDMQARTYDPATGRFTSVDPMSGTPGDVLAANPYPYAANDPLDQSDPTGLHPISEADFNFSLWNAWDFRYDTPFGPYGFCPYFYYEPFIYFQPLVYFTAQASHRGSVAPCSTLTASCTPPQALTLLNNPGTRAKGWPAGIVTGWALQVDYGLIPHYKYKQLYTHLLDVALGPPSIRPGSSPCSLVSVPGSSGAVGQWNPQVACILKLLKVRGPSDDVRDVDFMIYHESGGDPSSVEDWDIDVNFTSGTPSLGLVQVTWPTFKWLTANPTGRQLPRNPLNSIADLYAGLSCALSYLQRTTGTHNLDLMPGVEMAKGSSSAQYPYGTDYQGYGC